MTKKIEIQLFRISSDSKYLDVIFNCPTEYYFINFQLTVLFSSGATKEFDLSKALFIVNKSDEDINGNPHILSTVKKKNWTIRIPLSKLNIHEPAIYTGTLKAVPVYTKFDTIGGIDYYIPAPYPNVVATEAVYSLKLVTGDLNYYLYNETKAQFVLEHQNKVKAMLKSEIELENSETSFMVCSDVNFAYKCLLDDILKLNNKCTDISDSLIRNYLILYGHLAAMFEGELDIAVILFKMINKCFNFCGTKDPKRIESNVSCNCGKR